MTSEQQQIWQRMTAQSFSPRQWFDRDLFSGDGPPSDNPEKIMWVYLKTDAGFTVGFYSPDREWHSDSDHQTRDAAAARVHFLNGGK